MQHRRELRILRPGFISLFWTQRQRNYLVAKLEVSLLLVLVVAILMLLLVLLKDQQQHLLDLRQTIYSQLSKNLQTI